MRWSDCLLQTAEAAVVPIIYAPTLPTFPGALFFSPTSQCYDFSNAYPGHGPSSEAKTVPCNPSVGSFPFLPSVRLRRMMRCGRFEMSVMLL